MRTKLLLLTSLLLIAIYLRRRYLTSRTHILFMDKEQGRALFDRTAVRDLVDSYRYNECVARSAGMVSDPVMFKEEMVDFYKQAVLEFTPEEKRVMWEIVGRHSRLRDRRWTFIKMANYVDWGYPFTLEDVILLPEVFVSSMGDHSVKTLEHEFIHIEQRKSPYKFNKYYIERWGYRKPERIDVPVSLLNDTVTNPDGPESDWVRKMGDEWFWFALKLRQGKKPIGMAYRCLTDDSERFTVTEHGIPLTDMSLAFDGETNAYHPNEFIASRWSR